MTGNKGYNGLVFSESRDSKKIHWQICLPFSLSKNQLPTWEDEDLVEDTQIQESPSLCSVDIKNMFPSIFKQLALPAIKKQLLKKGYSIAEVQAVNDALEIVRDGTRVQWRDDTIQQVEGCSLGPGDACDYCDIALDSFPS